MARYVHYRAGDRIYEAGNRADGVYAIVKGAVELRNLGENGEETVLTLGPGEHFGDGILVGEDRRRSTVRALEDSKVLVLERDAYLRMVDAFPVLKEYFNEHLRKEFGVEPLPGKRAS